MNRPILTPILALAALAAAPAARAGWFDFGWNCTSVKGNGPQTTQTLAVSDWHKLEVSGDLDVTLVAGASAEGARSVTLSGPADSIAAYEAVVRGGTLAVKPVAGCLRGKTHLAVRIPVHALDGLAAAGSNSVRGEGTFKSDRLDLEVAGSGDVALNVDVGTLHTELSGSGELDLTGTAGSHHLEIAGSGEIRAAKLTVGNYEVEIAGSGDCEITATESIDADIAGSGDVLYHGTPARIEKSVAGSGTVRAADPDAVREPAPPAAVQQPSTRRGRPAPPAAPAPPAPPAPPAGAAI